MFCINSVYFRSNPERRISAVEYLVKHGADVNFVNSLGNSVLAVATSENHGPPIVAILRLLIGNGACLNHVGGKLVSVVWQAAR